jgi:Fic family protein
MIDISKITVTSEMLGLIGEIDEFKRDCQLSGTLALEKLRALRTTATIESIGSSTRIEGAKLTDREVEHLLFNLKNRPLRSQDEQEVVGYAYVCAEVLPNFESIDFSENVIKQLHKWLLKYSDKDQRHRGEYKKISNHVEAFDESGKNLGIVFKTSSSFETPEKMQELVIWTKDQLENKTIHPLLVIGIFIVVFLAIHPFQDGNGRLSRILTALLLLRSGYLYIPYSSLESIIEQNKESYYLALRKSQASLKTEEPDLSSWLLFFLRSLQKQKIHLQKKVSGEKTLMLYMPELAGQILGLIHKHGRLNISDIEKMTKGNRNTIKKYLTGLVTKGSVTRFGKGKATWYTLP